MADQEIKNEIMVTEVRVVAKEGSIQFSNYKELKAQVSAELEKYKGLTIDDENKQEIKKARADLNKISTLLDERRKLVKKDFLEPLNKFEDQVKELIELIKTVSDGLGNQVRDAEYKEKTDKKNEIEKYANELLALYKIDFIDFEDFGLNITLTTTIKKLKNEVVGYVDKVLLDLEEIHSDPNASRLLSKYRLNKNLQQSRITLNNELKQEAIVNQVKETEVKAEPKVEPIIVEKIEEIEPEIVVNFKVVATKSKLIQLREYLEKEGIKYE